MFSSLLHSVSKSSKIIIVGNGKVGHTLVEQLQLEPDKSDREKWQKILDKFGATGLL